MWLIAITFLAVISTILWYFNKNSSHYKLDTLALISWGTSIMVFADHLMSYIEEGEFFDFSTNAMLLTAILLLFALFLWMLSLLIRDPLRKFKRSPT